MTRQEREAYSKSKTFMRDQTIWVFSTQQFWDSKKLAATFGLSVEEVKSIIAKFAEYYYEEFF